MPPETFPATHLDFPASNNNLAIDTRLLIDLDVEVEFALFVKSIYC
jgi:hypothetical protein